MTPITATLLDDLRLCGDPPADAAIAATLAKGSSPAAAFRALVDQDCSFTSELKRFVDDIGVLPDWVDPERLAIGAEFFEQWGLEIGLALFCCALPIGYASQPVAQVLDLTSRLETDARRRVFETAQMVLDVTAPGGLLPGAAGYRSVLQVRLMHAGVRHLVLNDPRVPRRAAPRDGPHWCDDWGVPISQEHLLGGLLSFGYAMVRALDTLGLEYDADCAEAYLHLWSTAGYLMGIRPDLLPLDLERAKAAYELMQQRDVAATEAGQRLTSALLSLLDECGPARLAHGLPIAMMRMLLGEELADAAGVPRAGWQRHLLETVRPTFDRLGAAAIHDRVVRTLIRWTTRRVMVAFVQAERDGGRPPFTIPDHLANGFLGRQRCNAGTSSIG